MSSMRLLVAVAPSSVRVWLGHFALPLFLYLVSIQAALPRASFVVLSYELSFLPPCANRRDSK